jgi:hypothetical protein
MRGRPTTDAAVVENSLKLGGGTALCPDALSLPSSSSRARANALKARSTQGADADAARVRALAAYKDFLTLWKDADPDIPI